MKSLLVFAVCALLAACGKSPVMISGDAASAGARVIVDGREIGRLERMEDNGRVFAGARLSVARGERRFEFLAADGRSVSGRVDVRGDVYLRVDVASGTLLGAKP